MDNSLIAEQFLITKLFFCTICSYCPEPLTEPFFGPLLLHTGLAQKAPRPHSGAAEALKLLDRKKTTDLQDYGIVASRLESC